MLNQPTIEKLHAMKLHGMADAFRAQWRPPKPANSASRSASRCSSTSNGFGKRTGHLHGVSVGQAQRARRHRRHRLPASARARPQTDAHAIGERVGAAEPEHFAASGQPESARAGWPARWRRKPAGTAFRYCINGPPELFRELAVAHVDGSIGRVLLKLSRVDVLVLDDFAMAPLKDTERRDFLEICDDRYQRRSMILTSQVPIAHWHEQIGDPTVADSILDRLVHNAFRIELTGESMRKKRGRKPDEPQS